MKKQILLTSFVGMGLLLGLTACAKKQVVKNIPEEVEVQDEVASEELDIHGKDFVASPHVETIRFEYDSSDLSDAARTILASNAQYLKDYPEVEVLVEGHCDQRGTISYNLALGQKRAQMVRQYYTSLGIAGSRIGTLSYGKEKPLCTEMSEQCWSDNRRAETKIRILKSASDTPKKESVPAADKKKALIGEKVTDL